MLLVVDQEVLTLVMERLLLVVGVMEQQDQGQVLEQLILEEVEEEQQELL